MKNQANPNPDREYKVHIPIIHQFVQVTKEFYYEYYRPIWRTQKEAQKHGQCMCSKSKLWRCDGCCLDCSYHAPGNVWSLEYEQEAQILIGILPVFIMTKASPARKRKSGRSYFV